MELIDLVDLIFDKNLKTPEEYENIYRKRELKKGERVTRFAPSPTGFVHLGSLYTALISEKIAHDSNGIFYVRIEDTDRVRYVENGIENITNSLNFYGLNIDEGVINADRQIGDYGPYIQSERRDIYLSYAKSLMLKGLAYPSFTTKEELDKIRKKQEDNKEEIGYYGKYATDRNISIDEAVKRIKNGEEYVIRLKSMGDIEKKITVNDLIKGLISMPENNLDIVLIKSDGLPTYHFAHVIDDHLMHTTHVIRGDEWLSSLPIHVELFNVLGFDIPEYLHLSPVMIRDEKTKNRRKLSKRKDVYSSLEYYHEKGFPKDVITLYIMMLANSNFEEWYLNNNNTNIADFKLDFDKFSSDGPLFDYDKLCNIGKNYIGNLSVDEVYNEFHEWATIYDSILAEIMEKYKDKTLKFLSIGRGGEKPRKDYSCYYELRKNIWYIYDEYFYRYNFTYQLPDTISKEEGYKMAQIYVEKYYNSLDNEEEWFERIQKMAEDLGYAKTVKEYKKDKALYKGSITDVCNLIRSVCTTKIESPNLYDIMQLLGEETVIKRARDFRQY